MNEKNAPDSPRGSGDPRALDAMFPPVETFGAVIAGVFLGVAIQSLALLVVYALMVVVAEHSEAAGAIGIMLTYLANVMVTTLMTKSIARSGRKIRATTFLIVSIVSILLTASCCLSIWGYAFH